MTQSQECLELYSVFWMLRKPDLDDLVRSPRFANIVIFQRAKQHLMRDVNMWLSANVGEYDCALTSDYNLIVSFADENDAMLFIARW